MRNQVASEDLRRLGKRQTSTTGPTPTRMLGPSSMFSASSRSNSGRMGATAPGLQTGGLSSASGLGSRTVSKTEQTPATPTNAFRYV